MVPAAVAIPAIASVAGPILGSLLGNKKKKDVMGPILRDAMAKLDAIKTPTQESQFAQLQNYVRQGLITPEQYQAEVQKINSFDEININPSYRSAQEKSLAEFGNIADSGGMDAIDSSRVNSILNSLQASETSRLAGIKEDARRRGISGSGVELGASLQGDAEARNRAATAGLDTAALALQRKTDALRDQATLGSNIESQAYGQSANKASAANAMQQFNVNTKNTAAQWDAEQRAKAQQFNLAEKQRVADVNVNQGNTEELRRKGLIQTEFQNKVNKATGALQPAQWAASSAQNVSDSNRAGDNALWAGIGGAIGKAGSSFMDDQLKKKVV